MARQKTFINCKNNQVTSIKRGSVLTRIKLKFWENKYQNSGNFLLNQDIKSLLKKDMCKCIRRLKPEIEQRIARNLTFKNRMML